MKTKTQSDLYKITIEYENGDTKVVPVKASTREVAEERAMKRNPNAKGVKRST